MSGKKRYDNKKRLLKNGESQRKDGRYCYKYQQGGKARYIYSNRLLPTDKLINGKYELSLREKIAKLEKDIAYGIDIQNANMTVNKLVEKYISYKTKSRYETKSKYDYALQYLRNSVLGQSKVCDVKQTNAKDWIIELSNKGLSYNTIKMINSTLKASFSMAIQNDMVLKNPFSFRLNELIEYDAIERKALTEKEEKELLNFISGHKRFSKYYDYFIILLGTGLRVSELCGLTVSDICIEKRLIYVNHQLVIEGNKKTLQPPKTKSGIRVIPMLESVYLAFKHILENKEDCIETIDGHNDFIFLGKNKRVVTKRDISRWICKIRNEYNKTHQQEIFFTAHSLRHSFCTRMALRNMNPKILSEIMSHSDVMITLSLYTHATFDVVISEMERIDKQYLDNSYNQFYNKSSTSYTNL